MVLAESLYAKKAIMLQVLQSVVVIIGGSIIEAAEFIMELMVLPVNWGHICVVDKGLR